jgi:putative methyltransferase (TIGR04325 family)
VDKGRLSVLDFGGSLGSTYFQNCKFLNFIGDLSWNIVEQPHFVKTGMLYFQNEILHFYYDVVECVKKENPNVLILSSVLQYFEKPYDILDKLLSFNFPFVIIDRTLFQYKGYDRITIQRVPPRIYNASYPCWIFDYEKFLKFFRKEIIN